MSSTIALIELYTHHEVLYHYARAFLNQHYSLKIFTPDLIYLDAYDELKNTPLIQWFILKNGKARIDFIQENLEEINACDRAIFITLVSDFKFFAQVRLTTFSTLIVHNAVSYLRPFKGIYLQCSSEMVLDIWRLARFFLKKEAHWKKRMLANFDELRFPTASIQQYVAKKAWAKVYNIGPPMPFAAFNKKDSVWAHSKNQAIVITIPGTIHNNARDYKMVYRAFKAILSKSKQSIRLILLGKPKGQYGQKVIHLFQSLARDTFHVIHFAKSIPQLAFDRYMQQTDFLILPLRPYLKLGIYRELYGYTNVSGGVNDMLKFGKTALIPDFYPIEEEMKDLAMPFSNPLELRELLVEQIEKRSRKKT